MVRVLIATSNQGKLRDFAAAAAGTGVEIAGIENFDALSPVLEDARSFAGNAKKKAIHYSLAVPGEIVLADDSGLAVDALGGAPGVRSARYAADFTGNIMAPDLMNNKKLLFEMQGVPDGKRTARFVCVISAARDGKELGNFSGEAVGTILKAPRGDGGFGYDPLFFFSSLNKTFAELTAEEKARVSHRGAAFRKFLEWHRATTSH